jgi:hypothetical protein
MQVATVMRSGIKEQHLQSMQGGFCVVAMMREIKERKRFEKLTCF